MMSFNKSFFALLLGAAALTAQAASGQVIFSDNFEGSVYRNADPNSGGYGYSLSGQNGWVSNDPDTGAKYNGNRSIGQSDSVDLLGGFSTTSDDHAGFLGGFAPNTYPGSPNTRLSHDFNLGNANTMSFNVDFAVSASSTPFANHDTFGFNFRDSATAIQPRFSINFVVPNNGSNSFDNITYTSGNNAPSTAQNSFQLGLRYHLTVNVNILNNTFSASFYRENSDGTNANEGVFDIANNVAFTGTISNIAAAWNLSNATKDNASGAYTNPGNNIMAFDNLVVAVPEPSTYALLGLGLAGLVVYARSRRTAQA